jgi:Cu-processing system permease protein
MGFYILSRSMEAIQLISDSPIVASNSIAHKLINYMLDIIAYIIPELYKFTQTNWLVYISDIKQDFYIVIGQTFIYVIFLSSIALFDLYRKEL